MLFHHMPTCLLRSNNTFLQIVHLKIVLIDSGEIKHVYLIIKPTWPERGVEVTCKCTQFLYLCLRSSLTSDDANIEAVSLFSLFFVSFRFVSENMSLCTLIIHKPISPSLFIADLSHVFTLRRVLKERSMVHVVTGRARAIRIGCAIAGKWE